MRRGLAVVAAVVMIATAVFVRSRLDDNKVARTVRLTCSTELADVCTRLATRLKTTVEPAPTTAGRLATAAGPADLDGWLVPDPWPAIVDARRAARSLPPLFSAPTRRLARSPVVMVVWNERAARLRGRCGGDVNWRCLGDAVRAGSWKAVGGEAAWGPVKPGHTAPGGGALGAVVLAGVVTNWFGHGTGLSTVDLDADDFERWFTGLERAVAEKDVPLGTMLAAGPSVYDAYGTIEAEAGPALATAARRTDVTLLYPSPMTTADVVLATTDPASPVIDLAGGATAKKALADLGWRVDGQTNAPGIPATPALSSTNGLPPAGLVDALLARWREVTGR